MGVTMVYSGIAKENTAAVCTTGGHASGTGIRDLYKGYRGVRSFTALVISSGQLINLSNGQLPFEFSLEDDAYLINCS